MMQMGNMDKMGDMMGMCIENADKMGLTDDQIMKIKPVHREMQKKQVRFRADLKIAEIELMEIMEVKDFDLEKAISSVKKIEDIKTAHHLEMLKGMKEIATGTGASMYEAHKPGDVAGILTKEMSSDNLNDLRRCGCRPNKGK